MPLTVVLIGLSAALLLLVLIAAVIFLRAAFWGEQDAVEAARAAVAWRPSFLQGEALRDWAATTAEHRVLQRLGGLPTRDTAIDIVNETEAGAVQAMLPLARQAELERVVPCPASGQGLVGVTAPEALAIGAQIRKTHSRAEQKRIHDLALENSRRIGSAMRDFNAASPRCPLQREDHVCCVYAARPLRCRPLHAIAVARDMGARSVHFDAETSTPPEGRHERLVAEGIELGLARALRSAGLDTRVYELNGALARTMEIPDAAERWAIGEDVFQGCLSSQ